MHKLSKRQKLQWQLSGQGVSRMCCNYVTKYCAFHFLTVVLSFILNTKWEYPYACAETTISIEMTYLITWPKPEIFKTGQTWKQTNMISYDQSFCPWNYVLFSIQMVRYSMLLQSYPNSSNIGNLFLIMKGSGSKGTVTNLRRVCRLRASKLAFTLFMFSYKTVHVLNATCSATATRGVSQTAVLYLMLAPVFL